MKHIVLLPNYMESEKMLKETGMDVFSNVLLCFKSEKLPGNQRLVFSAQYS